MPQSVRAVHQVHWTRRGDGAAQPRDGDGTTVGGEEGVGHKGHHKRVIGARVWRALADVLGTEEGCVHFERLCVSLCRHLSICC